MRVLEKMSSDDRDMSMLLSLCMFVLIIVHTLNEPGGAHVSSTRLEIYCIMYMLCMANFVELNRA